MSTQTKTTHTAQDTQVMVTSHVSQDLKNAILVMSVTANLFIFTAWVILQVTTQFDSQFAQAIFIR